MMINLLSIRCGLAFAPYLSESITQFINSGAASARVVRQGGRGLIIRSEGDLILRHEHRQATLTPVVARHYSAAIQFRSEFYDVRRMADEVVLANAGGELLLSHPQSEIWLKPEAIEDLINTFSAEATGRSEDKTNNIPGWLKVSMGGERMLLSDQRTGRWLLLGRDHLRELGIRLGGVRRDEGAASGAAPSSIQLKGLTVHLQSAFRVLECLIDFGETRTIRPFHEITPVYSLEASTAADGLELKDSNGRIALTVREARKWADVMRLEIERLNARQVERDAIRTVFTSTESGRWILQWGDEVFLPHGVSPRLLTSRQLNDLPDSPVAKRFGEFLVLLRPATGGCVALTDTESALLEEGA